MTNTAPPDFVTKIFSDGHGGWVQLMPPASERVIKCPYGVCGDKLWVRETWRPDRWNDGRGRRADEHS